MQYLKIEVKQPEAPLCSLLLLAEVWYGRGSTAHRHVEKATVLYALPSAGQREGVPARVRMVCAYTAWEVWSLRLLGGVSKTAQTRLMFATLQPHKMGYAEEEGRARTNYTT